MITSRYAILVLLLGLLSEPLLADGGIVRASTVSGSWRLTLFSSPTPLRAGPVDLSVLIQDAATDQPVLDATVNLMLRHPDNEPILVKATPASATNRLLYAALLELPLAGTWTIDVLAVKGDLESRLQAGLEAGPPLPRLLSLWTWLAIPGIVLIVFVLNQWLIRTRHDSPDPKPCPGPS